MIRSFVLSAFLQRSLVNHKKNRLIVIRNKFKIKPTDVGPLCFQNLEARCLFKK